VGETKQIKSAKELRVYEEAYGLDREAWAKRRYSALFVNKLTDADAENSETDTGLDLS
jgi:hypothetical protein